MAIAVEELERLRDALLRARASGVRSMLYDGKRVEYATDAEMAAAIANLERRIARATGSRGPVQLFGTSKGVC